MKTIYTALFLTLFATPALADYPVIEAVAVRSSAPTWSFSVTITHPDTGWAHYADGWRILDADGQELGMRVLAHPHINEQPFTRALSGIAIPAGTFSVFVQARCLVDGWGDTLFEVILSPAN